MSCILLKFLKLYRYIHGFSVDVALGSLCSSLALSFSFHLSFSVPWIICLTGGVLIIYNVDHQWDIIRFKKKSTVNFQKITRYHLHQKYRQWIFLCLVVVMSLLFYSILNLQLFQIIYACMMVFLMVFYFYEKNQNFYHYHQKWMISLIYALGITSTSWLELQWNYPLEGYLVSICFFLLAYLNLLIINLYEIKFNLKAKDSSFLIKKGFSKTYLYCYLSMILLVFFSSLILLLNSDLLNLILAFLIMIFVSLCVILFQNIFKKNEYYRLVLESLFYLPIILLPWR